MQWYACFREPEILVGIYLALILPERVIWRRPRRRVGDGRGAWSDVGDGEARTG